MRALIWGTLALMTFSSEVHALTKNHLVTRLKYESEKKYYEVILLNQDGVFKSDDKFFKCLEKSLQEKKPAKISYEAMGLKITDCSNEP